MSRNLRFRSETVSPKQPARKRAVMTDDSSSDGYEGVDDITDDSDGEEPDVEAAEAQLIIEEDDDSLPNPRPAKDGDEVSWNGFDDDQEVLGDEQPYFDEHMARAANASQATLLPTSDTELDIRRVRFDLSDSSSTMSDDDDYGDEYPWPEPFVDQSRLDPSFRRQIEDDRDEDRASSDGGFWDFKGNEDYPHHQHGADKVSISSSGSEAESDESGYETDCGETTEEEECPVATLPARSVLKYPDSSESGTEEEMIHRSNPTTPRTPRAGSRSGPKLGSFEQLPERAWARFDLQSKRLVMFKAKIARRYSFDDAPQLPQSSPQDVSALQEMSPMISNSGNIMMSALYRPMGQLLGGEVLGPPEAYFPFTSISANGEITQDSPSSFDEDDMDEVDNWTMDDLIDYPFDETSDDNDDQDTSGETDGEIFTTPLPTTTSSEDQVHPLLLSNPRLVGAFRNNQNTHKLLAGGSNVTADSMRFSSRFNTVAIQGIRNGHLDAATAPITPLRKQKARLLDSSPSASQQNKRKFSGEQRSHKRTKSLH